MIVPSVGAPLNFKFIACPGEPVSQPVMRTHAAGLKSGHLSSFGSGPEFLKSIADFVNFTVEASFSSGDSGAATDAIP